MVPGQLDSHTGKKNETWTLSYTITESNCIAELSISSKLIKCLEGNIKQHLPDLCMRKDFSIRDKNNNHRWKY